MKKIIAALCALTLIFALSACAKTKNEGIEKTSATAEQTEESKTEEKQTKPTKIQQSKTLTADKAAYLFNKAYTEAEAWLNFSNKYWSTSECLETEKGHYFPIYHSSIGSLSSLKDHLYKYFSKNLVDSIVDEFYMERNGKLYKFSPEAGDRLPDYRLNNTTAKIISDGEGSISCDIIIDAYFDDGPDSPYTRQEYITENVSFVFENGAWVIDNYFSHNLYAPYTWNGQSPLGESTQTSDSAAAATTEELREFIPNS